MALQLIVTNMCMCLCIVGFVYLVRQKQEEIFSSLYINLTCCIALENLINLLS